MLNSAFHGSKALSSSKGGYEMRVALTCSPGNGCLSDCEEIPEESHEICHYSGRLAGPSHEARVIRQHPTGPISPCNASEQKAQGKPPLPTKARVPKARAILHTWDTDRNMQHLPCPPVPPADHGRKSSL